MDWTKNPLIAAFFAVRENPLEAGKIYSIKPYLFIDTSKQDSPFSTRFIQFLYPPVTTRRIELQKGLFSVHPFPSKPALIYDNIRDLTEMEYAFSDFFELGSKHKFQPFNGDLLKYQENYYRQQSEAKYFFNIPGYCKSLFETNIRKLGIDEMIFGDIDSLSKHLIYQSSNGQLQYIKEANLKFAYPIVEKEIEKSLVKFYDENPSILKIKRENNIISPNVLVRIATDKEEYWGHTVSGFLVFTFRPNVFKRKVQFETLYDLTGFYERLKIISEEVPMLGSLSSSSYQIEFNASISFPRETEQISVSNIDLIVDDDDDKFLESLEVEFGLIISKYKKLLEVTSYEEINSFDIGSDDFLKLLEKLKIHFS